MATSARSSETVHRSIRRSAPHGPTRPHRSSSFLRARPRSQTRMKPTAERNASGMLRRLLFTGEWHGNGAMDTASAHRSRRPFPASNASTAGVSPPEPSKHRRKKRSFTCRSPTAACGSQGLCPSASVDAAYNVRVPNVGIRVCVRHGPRRTHTNAFHHVHLRDTNSFADRHWNPGKGNIRWDAMFRALGALTSNPRLILEVRNKDTVRRGAEHLARLGLAQ